MKQMTIKENEAGQRLDKYLAKLLPKAPKSFFYKMLRKKNITLNKKKASGGEKLQCGDLVQLFLGQETLEKFSGEAFQRSHGELDILYEDEQVLLLNKPVGMLSQKGKPQDVSMVEYLITYLLESGQITEEQLRTFRPGICNRLDRNTSGILVAGKTLVSLQELSKLFHDRILEKYYLCLVKGQIVQKKFIKGYLHKNEKCNKVSIEEVPFPGASPIETSYEPLAHNREMTLLKVHLITGRTHQIRSHLAYIGHPILGDQIWRCRLEPSFFEKIRTAKPTAPCSLAENTQDRRDPGISLGTALFRSCAGAVHGDSEKGASRGEYRR